MKKIGITLLLIAVLLLSSGVIYSIMNSDNNKKTIDVNPQNENLEFDENYINRSEEEKQIQAVTGNYYYKINTSLKLAEDRDVDSLKLTNSRVVRLEKDVYSFSCNLVNSSSTEYPASEFTILLFTKDGKTLAKLITNVYDIVPGQTASISITTKQNILDAYDFQISRTGDYTPIINDVKEHNS